MALMSTKKVESMVLRFSDGTTEEIHPPKPATYRVQSNGTKLGTKEPSHWLEHEIFWRSDKQEGVG